MTMLGTCYLLSKTSLSPANVQTSLNTIYNSVGNNVACENVVEADDVVDDVDVVSNLIVASLSSVDNNSSQVHFNKPKKVLQMVKTQLILVSKSNDNIEVIEIAFQKTKPSPGEKSAVCRYFLSKSVLKCKNVIKWLACHTEAFYTCRKLVLVL